MVVKILPIVVEHTFDSKNKRIFDNLHSIINKL